MFWRCPWVLRTDFTYFSVMIFKRESRASIESVALPILRLIESRRCDRRPISTLQSEISPSNRASWFNLCSVSYVLSGILRRVAFSSFALRCLACFTSDAVRGLPLRLLDKFFLSDELFVVLFCRVPFFFAVLFEVCAVVCLRCCADASGTAAPSSRAHTKNINWMNRFIA